MVVGGTAAVASMVLLNNQTNQTIEQVPYEPHWAVVVIWLGFVWLVTWLLYLMFKD